MLIDEDRVKFSQKYPTGTCDVEFFLFSPYINFENPLFYDTYHGLDVTEGDDVFTQGAGAVRPSHKNPQLEDAFVWTFITENAEALRALDATGEDPTY